MSLPQLDKLRRGEENNYVASLQRLGDTASLAEDFIDAYDALSRLLRETRDPPDHLHVTSVLFLAARYQLERALLDVLRARISDAFQATRRAAELAAFAAKIQRHPHLARVWLEAGRGDEDYEKYRKKFSKDLFPVDDELLSRLGRRYDHASKKFHGTLFSMGGRASIEARAGALEFTFRTFEIDNDDPAEPASSFLWVLDTHVGILRVFVRALQEQMGVVAKAWEVRENALTTKLDAHRRRWEPVIRARIEKNEREQAAESKSP